jgi:hypothetical protein
MITASPTSDLRAIVVNLIHRISMLGLNSRTPEFLSPHKIVVDVSSLEALRVASGQAQEALTRLEAGPAEPPNGRSGEQCEAIIQFSADEIELLEAELEHVKPIAEAARACVWWETTNGYCYSDDGRLRKAIEGAAEPTRDTSGWREIAERVREAAAQVADAHSKRPGAKIKRNPFATDEQHQETVASIRDEERGEQIASAEIAKAIRAMSLPPPPASGADATGR